MFKTNPLAPHGGANPGGVYNQTSSYAQPNYGQGQSSVTYAPPNYGVNSMYASGPAPGYAPTTSYQAAPTASYQTAPTTSYAGPTGSYAGPTGSYSSPAGPTGTYTSPAGTYTSPAGPTQSQPNASYQSPPVGQSSIMVSGPLQQSGPTPGGPSTFRPPRKSTEMSQPMATPFIPDSTGVPMVTSGSAGTMIPTEKPFAFTTVTYAKSPPNKSTARKVQKFKQQYVESGRHADHPDGQGSYYQGTTHTGTTTEDNYPPAMSSKATKGRFVRKEKGSCGGCNERTHTCFDSTGGCCGCMNFGCCERGQKVPVAVDYSPEAI